MALPITESLNKHDDLEVAKLLDAIHQKYGYDFRDYAQSSVVRRLHWRKQQWQLTELADILPLVMRSKGHFQVLLTDMSIAVTELYRDPLFFKALINNVFPLLRTFPFFKIWHAGCATGEEVYSLAILLYEHGLYDRAQIYATDFNNNALMTAKEGIYSMEKIENAVERYRMAGGQGQFFDYFHFGYGNCMITDLLKKRITFAAHNLVTDGVFGEIELIICRNVMIYFNKTLKKRVIQLFHNSLYHGGYLCLGDKESLESGLLFKSVNEKAKIYKKLAHHSVLGSC